MKTDPIEPINLIDKTGYVHYFEFSNSKRLPATLTMHLGPS